MHKILAIASKDALSQFRNVVALAMMLAAPLVLASLLGLAFGGESGFSVSATKVAFVNLDEGYAPPQTDTTVNVGAAIGEVLTSPGLSDLLAVTDVVDEREARQAVDRGEVVVAVIVPAGLTRMVMSPASSAAATVVLYQNPTQTLGPAIVSGVVRQVIDAFNGARAVSAAIVHLAAQAGMVSSSQVNPVTMDTEELQAKIAVATEAYINTYRTGAASGVTGRGPQITGPNAKDPGVTGMVLTGMMVFFMLFGGANVARGILDEDYQGTLPRLFTTPTSRSVVLAGKMASVFVTVLAQAVILIVAGRLLFGIDWGGLAPVAVLTLAGSAVSAGLAIFLTSLMKTPAQAGAITSGVFVTLGLLGGNFMGGLPPGGFFSTVRHFTPNGWLLEGWDKVLRGAGLPEIWLQVLVVLAFTLVTFTLGAVIFRRRYA